MALARVHTGNTEIVALRQDNAALESELTTQQRELQALDLRRRTVERRREFCLGRSGCAPIPDLCPGIAKPLDRRVAHFLVEIVARFILGNHGVKLRRGRATVGRNSRYRQVLCMHGSARTQPGQQ